LELRDHNKQIFTEFPLQLNKPVKLVFFTLIALSIRYSFSLKIIKISFTAYAPFHSDCVCSKTVKPPLIKSFVKFQKLKRKKCDYDFVEIMACPSGCLNGGAQSRPEEGVSPKDWVAQLEDKYRAVGKQWPKDNPQVPILSEEWLGGLDSDKATHVLYTDYKEVEKMANSLAIKW
jgi:hypothetical protein